MHQPPFLFGFGELIKSLSKMYGDLLSCSEYPEDCLTAFPLRRRANRRSGMVTRAVLPY